tara:strand:- start:637 stop:849 length:213 start_codon:yes stop_codon:yes gene_type:complete
MNNDEAMAALVSKRTAVNTAINEMNRFVRENGDWKETVKTEQWGTVKRLAASGGVDISGWEGTPAPVEAE